MKKSVCIIFAFVIMLCSFSGCGGTTASKTNGSTSKTVTEVLNGQDAQPSAEAGTTSDEGKSSDTAYTGKVDVDLTSLNSTVVYSEVYNMMSSPDDYLGKTVKMKGSFAIYQTESKNYYACIIADATACCSQGLEFVWKGKHSYPKDYPDLGTEITVVGTFDSYYEGTSRYCQLINATVEF